MRIIKQAIICLLILSGLSANAQLQSPASMERMKMQRLWLGSQNAAGMVFDETTRFSSLNFGYGLQDGKYIGHLEYEYWSLAKPLRRIIESKVSKVASGFYGEFEEYGLYIFCKDDLTEEEVIMTMEYASELQRHLDITYSKMYLSLIDKLYVCDLSSVDRLHHKTQCTSYDISRKMCKEFFIKSLD